MSLFRFLLPGRAPQGLLLLGALACASAPAGRSPEASGGHDLAGSCVAGAGVPAESVRRITVLATNDLHGALEEKVYPWSEGRPVGGAVALSSYIDRERRRNPEATILLDGGDLMQGTPISNLVKGESVIEFFNLERYDAAAIGNHEFDWGIETLEKRIAQARFPLLSANIVRAAGTRPPWARPTALVERAGVRVGLIGLTTRSTPSTTLPDNVADLGFTDLASAVNEAVPGLERAGADLVVVVAHAGGFHHPDSALYRGEIVDAMRNMTPAVDLVVSGHTHTVLEGEVNGIPLLQARSSGTALGRADLWVDRATRDVVCTDLEVETTFADSVIPDPKVEALVTRYRERIGTRAERILGTAAHRLTTDRRRESALGDLIADAQRKAAGAQIGLTNSGGIRADIDEGPISWREAFEVQPFANVLYRLEIDGRALRRALENGVSGEHGIMQVSGIRVEVDSTAASGRRIRSVALEDGTALQPGRYYTVAVNNFLAQGGDGYTMLREAPVVTNTGLVDLDVFVDHLERLPQPIRYEPQGRIRFTGAGAAAVPAGDGAAGEPTGSATRGARPEGGGATEAARPEGGGATEAAGAAGDRP